MTLANQHRGEVNLPLGEHTLLLRPSYTAMNEWESTTGFGSVQLLYRMSTASYKLSELVSIVGAAARAGGSKMSDQKIGELLLDSGVVEAVPIIANMLASSLTGGKESDPDAGEASAAETTATGASPTAA